MKLKQISKMIKHLEKPTPEKILQLRTILSNDNIEYENQANSLQEWIQNAPEKITENLKKLYKISEDKDIKQKILKKHANENIEKIFSILNEDEEKEITKIMNRKNFSNVSIKTETTLVRLCLLGLCFKVENEEETTYIIPQEIKDIWKNKKTENYTIRERIEEIINMCGVIPKEEVWKIYQEAFETKLTRKEFYLFVEATKNITQSFYDYEEYYILYKINEKEAKKFIEIQENTKFDEKLEFDDEILETYKNYSIGLSPIGCDLLEYVQTLKTDVDVEFLIEITTLLREQTKFNAKEILEKVTEYIPALSKYTKTRIIKEIIRMYHDTRLYKFKGYKPFEINQYLSDKEIKEIEKKLEIEFESIDYLRLSDRYPEYLYGEYGEIKQIYDEENDITEDVITFWFQDSNIRKNKKFDTYIKERGKKALESILKIYYINNIELPTEEDIDKLTQTIIENKKEVIYSNLITLSEIEIKILKDIIKKGGYIEEEERNEYTERSVAIYDLINMGLIFATKNEKNKSNFFKLHIPNDSVQIITEFFNEYPMNKILNLRNLLRGIGIAYGVIEINEVREIIKRIKSDMLNLFDKYSNIINYRGRDLSIGYTNIIKSNEETTKILIMDELPAEQIEKIMNIEGEYKKFTYEEYLKLGEWKYQKGLSSYKKLSKYISENFDSDIECTEFIITEYIVNQQVDKLQAVTHLRHRIQEIYIVPDEIKQNVHNELLNQIVQIAEQMPQWDLKGNFIKKESLQKEKKVEIGRNDQCPCRKRKKI